METKCYGIGVIGCGVIWERGHWGGGLRHMQEEACVRYVYDLDPERAEAAGKQTGAEVLPSPERMFEDEDVDIITIATPPYARVEYVERATAAGKHLMLEKPMARTLEQALRIARMVKEHHVKCFVPFVRACSALYRELVRVIEAGDLGEPVAFVHTNLSGPYGWVPLDHWMHDMDRSGGPIFDYSIHFIELARACMQSEAAQVSYVGRNTTGRVKSDDQATLLIEYTSGALGEFTKSWCFPPEVRLSHQTTHVVCRDAVAVLGRGVQIHTAEGIRELSIPEDTPPGRVDAYRNLMRAIEEDVPLYASEFEGLRVTEILEAGLISRERGQKQTVELHELE